MINVLRKNFIFLSQIVGVPVVDLATGARLGRVADVVATLREMYPRVSGLALKLHNGKKVYLPWRQVARVNASKSVEVSVIEVFSDSLRLSENEILLKETFWDKQIVDIEGSKVVRVNDLHLLKEDLNIWLVHMDVGIPGLLRRLGCYSFVNAIVRSIFSADMEDRFISWKFVQPITPSIGSEALALKVHHSKLSHLHPADLADILIDLGTDERIAVLNSLDNETAAQMFQELPLKIRVQLVDVLPLERASGIVNAMAMDEAVDLLSSVSHKKLNAIKARLPKEKVEQINTLLKISERVAGSLMNTDFVAVPHTATAGMVLQKIKTEAKKFESIYYIYVLDDSSAVTGVLTLRQALVSAPEKPVLELMRKRVVKVHMDTDVHDVAEIFYKYNFTAVPVVDRRNILKGIITMRDAFETVFPPIRNEIEEPS